MKALSLTLAGAALLAAPLLAGCGTSAPATRADGPPARADGAIPRLGVDVRALSFPAVREPAVPAVERLTLPNGIVVFLLEDRSLPLVRATARIGHGTAFDPAAQVGLSSVAAQTMRSGGAGSLTPEALNAALEDRGASIEAGASEDAVTVSMRTLTEHVGEVLPLFVDVLARPRFDEAQVALAKTQQRSAIARRNDTPQAVAQRILFQQLYGEDSPYARTTQYWTIDAISRDDLVAWHREHIRPGATYLAVWGDFDAADMAEQLRQAFASWPGEGRAERRPLPPVPETRRPGLHFVEKGDVAQSTILIGHLGEIRLDHPDYPALVVMNQILGGGFSSRLFQRVRTDLGLAYNVGGVYTASFARPGVFYASTNTRLDATIESLEAMQEVIRSMQTRAPSEQELSLAKDAYLNSFVFNFESRAQVLGRQLTYAYYGYPEDFLQQQQARIAAVTAADVQRVARQYLSPDETAIVVLGTAEVREAMRAAGLTFQEHDITIPTTPPGTAPAAPAGSADAGQALLGRVYAALGGADAFAAIRTMRSEATSTAQTPMGEMEIGGQVELLLPDRARIVQQTPVGNVTIVLNGARAQLEVPGVGVQPAPAPVVDQIRGQLALDLAYVLARADRASAQALPREGNLDVLQLAVPGAAQPVRLFVGADGRPVRLEATQVGPAGPAAVVIALSDYRPVSGLVLPFASEIRQNGEVQARGQITRLEINPALDESRFAVGS
ncbi:MAG: M16 family metallopeptidase [Rubricoccaceae bacterium]